jgi:hypothetical protein
MPLVSLGGICMDRNVTVNSSAKEIVGLIFLTATIAYLTYHTLIEPSGRIFRFFGGASVGFIWVYVIFQWSRCNFRKS